MPGKQSDEEQVETGAAENLAEEDLGGLTAEELRQGQEAALELEDMMALSAQTLVRAEVDELYQQVRPLGQGRFGRVLLVTHRQKGTRAWRQILEGQRVADWAPAEAGRGRGVRKHEPSVASAPSGLCVLGKFPTLSEPRPPPSEMRVMIPPLERLCFSLSVCRWLELPVRKGSKRVPPSGAHMWPA